MRFVVATSVLMVSALLACKSFKDRASGSTPAASAASAGTAAGTPASAAPPMAENAGKLMAAPTSPLPKPLKAGQFVRYNVTERGGQRDFSYSVVGEEGGAHWVQVVTERGGRRVVIQLLLRIGNRSDPKSAKLLAVKMKLGSMVKEFRGAALQAMRKSVDDAMGELAIPGLDGLEQQDVTVPAGTFKSCYKRESTVTLLQKQSKSREWLHPGVPVIALVKSEAMDSDYKMELAEYGETGAKNELQ
jgi:hypothetical protein